MGNEEIVIENYNESKKTQKRTGPLIIVYRVFCVFLILTCLCFIAFNIVFDHNKIVGCSMQPTFNYPNVKEEDYAYYSSFFDYTYGDIIVAKRKSELIIKRVIALENDKVEIKKHTDEFYHIFVNDVMQDESYLLDLNHNEHLFETIKTSSKTDWPIKLDVTVLKDSLSFNIPENYAFFLGDNRLESLDCADYGPVLKETITYKVIFVVPYEENFIEYWWKRIFGK